MQGLLHLPWKSHTIIRDQGGKKTLSGFCHRHFFKSFSVCHRTTVLRKTQNARRTVSTTAGTFCLCSYTFGENRISLLTHSFYWKLSLLSHCQQSFFGHDLSGVLGIMGKSEFLARAPAVLLVPSMGGSAARYFYVQRYFLADMVVQRGNREETSLISTSSPRCSVNDCCRCSYAHSEEELICSNHAFSLQSAASFAQAACNGNSPLQRFSIPLKKQALQFPICFL